MPRRTRSAHHTAQHGARGHDRAVDHDTRRAARPRGLESALDVLDDDDVIDHDPIASTRPKARG
jgi:hypothetical protein